jgi:hypothetical protein
MRAAGLTERNNSSDYLVHNTAFCFFVTCHLKRTAGSLESVVSMDDTLFYSSFLLALLFYKGKVCGSSKDINTSHCCRNTLNNHNKTSSDAEPTNQTKVNCVSEVQGNN